MDAVTNFLLMGGYAAFVWPAFAVATIVLAGLWLASWRRLKAQEAALDALAPQASSRPSARRPARISPRAAP